MSEPQKGYAVVLVNAEGDVTYTTQPKDWGDAVTYARLAVGLLRDVAEACVVSLATGETLESHQAGRVLPVATQGQQREATAS